jgi:hypothetical protein
MCFSVENILGGVSEVAGVGRDIEKKVLFRV